VTGQRARPINDSPAKPCGSGSKIMRCLMSAAQFENAGVEKVSTRHAGERAPHRTVRLKGGGIMTRRWWKLKLRFGPAGHLGKIHASMHSAVEFDREPCLIDCPLFS
jgi:hypothetical protein